MKLYFAPNSRAVRTAWLLYEMQIDFDLHRFERIGDPAMRSPEYLKINPNGRIPALVDGDVTILESGAIAQYLAARHGPTELVPEVASTEFPVYLEWLHYGEGMIMGPMNNYIVETMFLKPERRSAEHAERAKKLLGRAMQAVDAHMADRDYLAGAFSVADTITGHACCMCDRLGIDFSQMPNAKAYVDRLLERPAFQKALAL